MNSLAIKSLLEHIDQHHSDHYNKFERINTAMLKEWEDATKRYAALIGALHDGIAHGNWP